MDIFLSPSVISNPIVLEEDESHHVLKVMRARAGDELLVTDGKGKLVKAKLVGESRKQCLLEPVEIVREENESRPAIHLAISPTKNTDRFEWFLEKATEVGVTMITPVICQRTARDKIKTERAQKILSASMKQALRLWMPELNPKISFQNFLESQKQNHDRKFIAHCQSQNLPSLQSLCKSGENVLIMVGPEGDFTQQEIQMAVQNGFSEVTLGKNRLRTETAGVIAVNTVQMMNEKTG